jgi:hypothetical protein
MDLLRDARAVIEPVFPDAPSNDLAGWYTVLVPASSSNALLSKLQQHAGVLAAFIKPREALP